jgi:hypothetical protein
VTESVWYRDALALCPCFLARVLATGVDDLEELAPVLVLVTPRKPVAKLAEVGFRDDGLREVDDHASVVRGV